MKKKKINCGPKYNCWFIGYKSASTANTSAREVGEDYADEDETESSKEGEETDLKDWKSLIIEV